MTFTVRKERTSIQQLQAPKNKTMDIMNEQGSWHEHKTKLMTMFSDLTEDDLHYEEGKSEEMFSHVQNKLGKTREELADIIATFY